MPKVEQNPWLSPKGKILTITHEPVEELQLDDKNFVTDQGPFEALYFEQNTHASILQLFSK